MIPVRGFEGKRVAVFGLARSGLAAARALLAGGAQPEVWDDGVAARAAAELDRLALEQDLREKENRLRDLFDVQEVR